MCACATAAGGGGGGVGLGVGVGSWWVGVELTVVLVSRCGLRHPIIMTLSCHVFWDWCVLAGFFTK